MLPLAHWYSTYDQYVLPKLLLARFLLLGMAALFVARTIYTGSLVIKRSPLDVPILLFLTSAVLSSAFAVNLNVAIFGIYSRYDGVLTMMTYAGLYWLTMQALDGATDARALFRTLLVSGYAVAALALVQTAGDSLGQNTVARAYGTLGQWNVLGGFLAMLWPLAYREAADATSRSGRVLAINALIVLGAALLFTFSRSAWLGSAAGAVVLVAAAGSRRTRLKTVAIATGVSVCAIGAGLAGSVGFQLGQSLAARAMTVLNPSEWGPRVAIWHDTLPLIASRSLLGYGPDSFGLVFPRFNTVYYVLQVDKAHAETLQIGATQGLIGVAAYLLILLAFMRAFWRGRSLPGAAAVFAGFTGYQVALQLNFTALASALPFWIFAGAAIVSWDAVGTSTLLAGRHHLFAAAGAVAAAALVALAVFGIVLPYRADASLLAAVNADFGGQELQARSAAAQATSFGPQESVYAVEAGNIAFEHGDWATARLEYGEAVRLGTYNPNVFRNLAIADRNLALISEARDAALGAYYLNRFDPANRALLAQFGGPDA